MDYLGIQLKIIAQSCSTVIAKFALLEGKINSMSVAQELMNRMAPLEGQGKDQGDLRPKLRCFFCFSCALSLAIGPRPIATTVPLRMQHVQHHWYVFHCPLQ